MSRRRAPIGLVMTQEPARPPALVVSMVRDRMATVTEVDETISDLLGWRPADLVGRPSTDFIHPYDQANGVRSWVSMLEQPGRTVTWYGRYRTAAGGWLWLELTNTNHLDDPTHPRVVSTLAATEDRPPSVEEQLLAREQLLSLLADALPVGLVEVDVHRAVRLVNAQLQAFLHSEEQLSIGSLLARVLGPDRPLIESALDRALSGQPVDDLEFRVVTAGDTHRVCALSLRTLTDALGEVTGAIGCVSDVTERVQLRRQLEYRANIDGLTSCMNRRAIVELLGDTLRVANGRGTAVLFVDLDGFKEINDRHGHAIGDLVLVAAADRLRSALRANDHVGRLGGDEFLVVCPRVGGDGLAGDIVARVEGALQAELDLECGVVSLRASVGLAFTTAEADPSVLIAQADSAMYRSKRRTRSG
jgi:diguanylate cyclase (GGDEF)-like protein/PAS domain S-box-containing protein